MERALHRTLLALLALGLALGSTSVSADNNTSPADVSASTAAGEVASPTTATTAVRDGSTTPTPTTTHAPSSASSPGSLSDNQTAETTGAPTAATTAVPPQTTTVSASAEKTSPPSPETTIATTTSPETSTTPPHSVAEDVSNVTKSVTETEPSATDAAATVHPQVTTVVPTSTVLEDLQPNATSRSEQPLTEKVETTTVPMTSLPTRRRLPDFTEEDVVMKSPPTQRRLLLVLRGNCSHDNLKSDVEGAFRNLSSPSENISVTDIRCTTLLDVNVTLKAGELQLKQLLRNLSLAGTLQLGESGRQFLLTDFSVKEQVATDGARTVRSRWVPTREELIIYVAVAVLFGIVLIIACVVCSIRCCRRQPSKTLDFLDTPRLDLRLEDYTLTRIPRPHTLYADHLRTPDQELGVVQAFDTCVVPLEDVLPPPPPAPTVPAPPCPPPRRPDSQWRTEPLMTFGGKPRASPSNGLKVVRRSARAEEDDEDEHSSLRSGTLSASTERLARRDSGRRRGVDNPIYLVDRRKSKG